MTIATIADIVRTHGAERPDAPGARVRRPHDHLRRARPPLEPGRARRSRAAGVGAGDRVAFIDKNGPEYFEVTFGARQAQRGQRRR